MVNKYEQLALWYLRLNGYLTVSHFILHPGRRGSQIGEVDILGVRFPYSEEIAGAEMKRDDALVRGDEKTDFIIAEVKSGECCLNGPWTRPDTEKWDYVLKWLGMVPKAEVAEVAQELYSYKRYETDKWAIRLVCFGKKKSNNLPESVVQLTFKHVIEFMSDRLRQFRRMKQDREQWTPAIKELFDMMVERRPNDILKWLKN